MCIVIFIQLKYGAKPIHVSSPASFPAFPHLQVPAYMLVLVDRLDLTLPINFERYFDGAADPYSDGYSMQICVPVR